MAENSKIEWTHHTFNPWEGCQKVGPGCDHCYAETRNARFGGGVAVNWGPGAPRRRTSASNWAQPVKWNATAARLGVRYRVFCASLADVFDNTVPASWRADLFQLIERTPHLDWLLVTKRVGNVRDMAPVSWLGGPIQHGPDPLNIHGGWPPNVWLGITVVNQQEADRDIPKLLAMPARTRFLSVEPMLGAMNLCRCDGASFGVQRHPFVTHASCPLHGDKTINWVIVGGESGPHARPMHPAWARSLRDQSAAAGVPFLFKQWGEWVPMMGHVEGAPVRGQKHIFPDGTVMGRAGKKAAGRLLDGLLHDGYPEVLP